MIDEEDDDALQIKWVRWVPVQPLPFERYRAKYGEPTKYDFDPSSMVPKAKWDAIALEATLSDDKKSVLFVETNFSRSEWRAAWLRSSGFVPDWLKDDKKPATSSDKPAQVKKQSPKKVAPAN